jgi:hypothetical protein
MFQDTVVRAGEMIAGVVDGLDPDAVSGSAARELWSAFDRAERLCAAGKTLLARRLAATHQRNGGTRSAAEEMSRRSGSSAGAAKDSLDTSQRLPDQAPVETALRRGELSSAQVALISAAVAADPSQAERLTDLAGKVSLAELREECARVKAAADPDPEATNRRIHARRELRRWIDSEGFWNLHAKGTPQAGAAFNAVLDTIVEQFFGAARRDGRRESPDVYGFDALMAMADRAADQAARHCHGGQTEHSTAAGAPTADTGPATGGPDRAADRVTSARADIAEAGQPGIFAVGRSQSGSPRPPAPRTVGPRYLALLRIDVEALRRGRIKGEEICEITGVGPVPVSVARDLLGEAIVKLVITNGVDVLNVTHLGRGPTAAQRAALMWMNPTCSVQGCNRRRIEWDHREDWAKTRHTRMDELDPLCEFHHDLKTRLGWALVAGTGKRPFVPPDDPRHPRYQPSRTGPDRVFGRGATTTAAADGVRPPTAPASAPPPARAGPPRTRHQAAAAQLSLPDPPAEQRLQPPWVGGLIRPASGSTGARGGS